MEEIRVLQIISTLVSGGVQKVVMGYGEYVRQYGVTFDYIVQGEGKAEIEEGLRTNGSRIFVFPSLSENPTAFFRQLRAFLKVHPEYKVAHVHLNYLNGIPLLAAKMAGVKVRISHSHSNRMASSMAVKVFRAIGREFIAANATDFWACSIPAYRWLYGKKQKNEFILNNAVDEKKFAYNQEIRQKMRASLGFTDEFVCVCVGTLSTLKNQTFLLKVFEALRPYPKIRLLLVGDGDKRELISAKVQELGLTETVSLLGDQADVSSILHASDYFLLPSLSEGLSVSTIEAQISGLPCLVSNGVPKDVKISEKITFLEIQENNISEWADKIIGLYQTASQRSGMEAEKIEKSGYALAAEAYRLATKYKELLKR